MGNAMVGGKEMWRKFAFGEFPPPFLARGAVKFIILDLLKDKPKHGYEIMKDMEAKGGGLYAASPGSVYPTLQMLEEMGYVNSRPEGSKKVYEITPEGRKYLAESQETVEDIPNPLSMPFAPLLQPEVRDTIQEFHGLFITLVRAARTKRLHRPEQFQQVRDILARSRKEIEDLLGK
jgi:DNA-binding PadR family transcriptional regulator